MEDSIPDQQEGTDRKIIEEIYQLERIALGEGVAVCEACGEELREGAPLVVFAFRPANQLAFETGHVKCTECRHEPTEYFTLGVRELVLEVVLVLVLTLQLNRRGRCYWLRSRAL